MSDGIFIPDTQAPAWTRFTDYVKFLFSNPNNLGGHRVTLLDGAHAGILSVFEGQACTIGGGAENDLILVGDGLAANHLKITPERSVNRGFKVEALEGPVEIEGKLTLQPGEWAELTGSNVICAGRARFELSPVIDGHQIFRGAIFIGSVGLLSFIVVSVLFSSWSQTRASFQTLGHQSVSSAQPVVASFISMEQATEMARIQLGTLNLGHMVKITDLQGTMKFDGMVPESFAPSWMAFLQWYDGQRGYPPMVNAVNVTGADENIPSIATVWLGNEPMVEFSDGTRGMVGSVLTGGWRITDVDRNAVSFERNGATISVSY